MTTLPFVSPTGGQARAGPVRRPHLELQPEGVGPRRRIRRAATSPPAGSPTRRAPRPRRTGRSRSRPGPPPLARPGPAGSRRTRRRSTQHPALSKAAHAGRVLGAPSVQEVGGRAIVARENQRRPASRPAKHIAWTGAMPAIAPVSGAHLHSAGSLGATPCTPPGVELRLARRREGQLPALGRVGGAAERRRQVVPRRQASTASYGLAQSAPVPVRSAPTMARAAGGSCCPRRPGCRRPGRSGPPTTAPCRRPSCPPAGPSAATSCCRRRAPASHTAFGSCRHTGRSPQPVSGLHTPSRHGSEGAPQVTAAPVPHTAPVGFAAVGVPVAQVSPVVHRSPSSPRSAAPRCSPSRARRPGTPSAWCARRRRPCRRCRRRGVAVRATGRGRPRNRVHDVAEVEAGGGRGVAVGGRPRVDAHG